MNLDQLENQTRALIDQDQKIEAIKLVRQTTGWGLRESKEYVDTIARAALPALSPADEAALKQAVKALIQQDRYAEAVKHVRILTNWGLRDSKDYVDSLESKKKRRRKRRRRRAKTGPAGAGFRVGDSVVVKPKGVDSDLGIDIGGWCGRVAEKPGAGGMVLIGWDSVTLRNMPDSVIVQCKERGLDWTGMALRVQEVELTSPRDTEDNVARVIDELSRKHAWSWLGDEGVRIGKILAGVDPDDEMAVLDAWGDYLAKHLSFPFEAEVSEYQERGPLQAGDRITVQGISDVDYLYGIIVRLRHGRERYAFPLCDLEVTDEDSPNYQTVRDYAVWFANR